MDARDTQEVHAAEGQQPAIPGPEAEARTTRAPPPVRSIKQSYKPSQYAGA